jgi:hypothetical protein
MKAVQFNEYGAAPVLNGGALALPWADRPDLGPVPGHGDGRGRRNGGG